MHASETDKQANRRASNLTPSFGKKTPQPTGRQETGIYHRDKRKKERKPRCVWQMSKWWSVVVMQVPARSLEKLVLKVQEFVSSDP